jgi:cell division protein FtsQ
VNDPAGDVLVHLGSSDYLRRYKIYVTHAQGWRQQFQKLESVDLRYDNQIIVNPDMERFAKSVPLSPAAAKAAVAAGVKPVSLLTRIGPNDRPVPKPAFELTQKKLDASKSAASGATKPTPKTKWKKPTAKASKATAGTKKAVSTGKADAAVAKSVAVRKSSSPAGHELAVRPVVDAKKTSPKPAAKSSGSQKPSPAIAKSQSQSQDSD